MAKRPPSSCTIGRSSGGITGTTSRIIALGSFVRRPLFGVATVEAGDDLQALDRLLAALGAERLAAGLARVDRLAQLDLLLVEVDAVDQLLDRVGAGATLEVVAVLVAQLAPQDLVVDDLPRVQVLELVDHVRSTRSSSTS